jgi:glycerol uptake facilitator-like aquaporin
MMYCPVELIQKSSRNALLRAGSLEAIGTAVFVWAGVLSSVESALAQEATSHVLTVSFVHGLMITALILSFGPISGSAHFNPSISIMMALIRELSFPRCFVYVVSQMLGSLLGALLVWGGTTSLNVSTKRAHGMGLCTKSHEISYAGAVSLELVAAIILNVVVLFTAVHTPRTIEVSNAHKMANKAREQKKQKLEFSNDVAALAQQQQKQRMQQDESTRGRSGRQELGTSLRQAPSPALALQNWPNPSPAVRRASNRGAEEEAGVGMGVGVGAGAAEEMKTELLCFPLSDLALNTHRTAGKISPAPNSVSPSSSSSSSSPVPGKQEATIARVEEVAARRSQWRGGGCSPLSPSSPQEAATVSSSMPLRIRSSPNKFFLFDRIGSSHASQDAQEANIAQRQGEVLPLQNLADGSSPNALCSHGAERHGPDFLHIAIAAGLTVTVVHMNLLVLTGACMYDNLILRFMYTVIKTHPLTLSFAHLGSYSHTKSFLNA